MKMKTLTILAFLFAIFAIMPFVSANSCSSSGSVVNCLLYDSTNSDSLTINYGESLGLTASASSILEDSMTLKIELIDSNGNSQELYKIYTTENSYSKHLTFGQKIYENSGNYTIKSTLTSSPDGSKAVKKLSLEILPESQTNSAPKITSTPTTVVDENTQYNYQVTATDADGDALSYSLTQKPSWLSINSNGLISGNSPEVSQDTQYQVTVEASDGEDFDRQTFTITVLDVIGSNNIPVIQSIGDKTINESTQFSQQVTATDADNDPLTYSLTQKPSWLSLNSNQVITGTAPNVSTDTQYVVTVEVSDGQATETEEFTITVLDVDGNGGDGNQTNQTDTISPTVSITNPSNQTYSSHRTTLEFNASDNIALDECWYTLDGGQTNVTTACNVQVTGLQSNEGSNTWTVYARDTSGNIGSDSVTFTVNLGTTALEDEDDDKKRESYLYTDPDTERYQDEVINAGQNKGDAIDLTVEESQPIWKKFWNWLKSLFGF